MATVDLQNITRDPRQPAGREILRKEHNVSRVREMSELLESGRCFKSDFEGDDSDSGEELGFDASSNYDYHQVLDIAGMHPWVFWQLQYHKYLDRQDPQLGAKLPLKVTLIASDRKFNG